nr:MAG TPA: hypothetical protein [Caudoviricetes sp.]
MERPDTIASVSPPEPVGAGELISPWGPGAQFSLRKLRRFVEFEPQFVLQSVNFVDLLLLFADSALVGPG